MSETREDIVNEILHKLLFENGVLPEDVYDKAVEDAVKSVFEIFGRTGEINNDRH